MDQIATFNLKLEKNDKTFTFSMPLGCPIGEAYDATHEMLNELVLLSQEAADKAKRPEEKKKEEVKS
jgi:alpha-D-ribose 1-methylphosphonate 5-triphosphate synthase subunit PhnI